MTALQCLNNSWNIDTGSTCLITCLCLCYVIVMQGKRRKAALVQYHNPKFSEHSFTSLNPYMDIPIHLWYEIFYYLHVRDLVSITQVSKEWSLISGDQARLLWKNLFYRDYKENGKSFNAPQSMPWRQYYFQHNLSRSLELAKALVDKGGCCVVIHDQVYDVESFLYSHPGGHQMILDSIGIDATSVWEDFGHSSQAKVIMKHLQIQDPVLSLDPSKRLKGNLHVVITRWKKHLERTASRILFQSIVDNIWQWKNKWFGR